MSEVFFLCAEHNARGYEAQNASCDKGPCNCWPPVHGKRDLPGFWDAAESAGIGRQRHIFPLDGAWGLPLLTVPRRLQQTTFPHCTWLISWSIEFVYSIMFLKVTGAGASLSFASLQWVLEWGGAKRKRAPLPPSPPPTLLRPPPAARAFATANPKVQVPSFHDNFWSSELSVNRHSWV